MNRRIERVLAGVVVAGFVLCGTGAAAAQTAPIRGAADNARAEAAATGRGSDFGARSMLLQLFQTSYELKCSDEETKKCLVDPKIHFSPTHLSMLRNRGVIRLGLCDESTGCRRRLPSVAWDPDNPDSDLGEHGLTESGIFRLVLTINNFPDAAHSNALTFLLATASSRR